MQSIQHESPQPSEPEQHESPQPPEPEELVDFGVNLSKDDGLQTRMKEEPSFNGSSNSHLVEDMKIIRNNLQNIQSSVSKKAKERKRWYYGAPKHTQEDMFKEIELGLYTDPRTRTRRSKYSLPSKKNTLEEKDNRPSRAKHLTAKKRGRPPKTRGRPPKKKVPVLVNLFHDSALEHNYLDAQEKKKLIIRLQDIMKKINSDTNSSFVEDIKNVVQNKLFKGVSNYNISGDYSEQENNLIQEVKKTMEEIRPYVLIDKSFFKLIEKVLRELKLDPNLTLEESTPEYDPRNRNLYNPKFNENDFFNDINQIKQNNNDANNTNNRQPPSSYAYAPRVLSEEKKVPKLLITYPKLLRAVSRGLISSSRLDALDLNNTKELTDILNEVEQINKKISL